MYPIDVNHLKNNWKYWIRNTEIHADIVHPELADLEEDLQHLSTLLHAVIVSYRREGGQVPDILNLFAQCVNPETEPENEIPAPKTYFEHISESGHGVSKLDIPEDTPIPLEEKQCNKTFDQIHQCTSYIPNAILLNTKVLLVDLHPFFVDTLFNGDNQLRSSCVKTFARIKKTVAMGGQSIELTEFLQNHPLIPQINYRIQILIQYKGEDVVTYLVKTQQGTWHFIHGVQPSDLFFHPTEEN